jgi:hypothetical protein
MFFLQPPSAEGRGPKGFVDGNRFTFSVTLAGRKLVDLGRLLRYGDQYPNGKRCDRIPCRHAVIETFADVP